MPSGTNNAENSRLLGESNDHAALKSPKQTTKNISVNITFLKRLARLIVIQYSVGTPYLSLASKCIVLFATVLVVVAACLHSVGMVFISSGVGNWTEHLLERDYKAATYDIIKLFVIFFGNATCYSVMEGCKALLYFYWRKSITLHMLQRYLTGKNYYDILQKSDIVESTGASSGAEGDDLMDSISSVLKATETQSATAGISIDNPDQRIQSDVDTYCTSASEIYVTGMMHLAGITTSGILILANRMHPTVFLVLAGWPILNTLIFRVLMPTITKSVYLVDEHEGYFRYAHARLREYSESMAFFRADSKERQYIETSFRKLLYISRVLAVKYFPLQFYTMAMQRIPQITIFLWLLAAIMLHWGPFTPDITTEALQNLGSKWFMLIQASTDAWFGLFLLGGLFTTLTGNTHRIVEMLDVCDRVERHAEASAGDVGNDPDKVEVRNLAIVTPTNKVLIRDVSFTVEPGDSLCIFGESGCGKTTLLRQLAGLVPCPQGSIRRPTKFGRDGTLFLPQIPYLIRGTLIHQIIYPYSLSEMPATPEEVRACLEKANVAYIADRYGFERKLNWDKILSEGEKQRLQIARVLFHKPKFAFMDESSASLDTTNQRICYSALRDAGITLVSVAHVEAVKVYHSQLLTLHKDGTWTLERIELNESEVDFDANWEEFKHGDPVPSTDSSHGSTDDIELDEHIASRATGNTGINLLLVKRFFALLKIILKPKNFCVDIVLPVICIIVFALNAVATFPIIIVYGQMVAALFEKDPSKVFIVAGILLGVILTYSFIWGLSTSLAMLQGIEWRRKITEHCHSLYFSKTTYFKMISLDKVIENSDQRIASDARSLVDGWNASSGLGALEFLSVSLLTFSILAAVAVILLTHVAAFAILGVVILVYSVLHILLMVKISKLQFQVDTKEGWFRFQMLRLKEHAEQVALYDGRRREEAVILHYFDGVMEKQAQLLFFSSILTSYSAQLNAGSFLINYTIVTTLLSFGLIDLGGGSTEQQAGQIQTIQGLVGLFVMNITSTMALGPKVGKNIGFLGRVSHFLERCKTLQNEYESTQQMEESADVVSVENVTVKTPKQEVLMRDVSLEVPRGKNLLIQGSSGCGKSSILRQIGGLWPLHEGNIKRPLNIGSDGIFFAPQKCYFCLGSLKDNIIYPEVTTGNTDEELEFLLSKVNLSYLYERIGGLNLVKEWTTVLSPGEQQRLAVARILYHRPAFVLADEITSSCDLENEKLIYDLLREYGVTCISVGHRESIVQHHEMIMRVGNQGEWSLLRQRGGAKVPAKQRKDEVELF